ncbi:MAG TPA: CHAP domain-containing protein [Candidatus Saccharimonadales bacterium]|nr:CHAP domain-containing protein [Candidatus Saccharimonadales bacterium]
MTAATRLVTGVTEKHISTNSSVKAESSNKLRQLPRPLAPAKRRKSGFEWLSRSAIYISVAILMISLVSIGYQSPINAEKLDSGKAAQAVEATTPSVDQVTAANLAASIAEYSDLAVASKVSNVAISLNTKQQLSQTNNNFLSKPQIIEADQTGIIRTYHTHAGDTVSQLAKRYGVSERSIKWSNDLTSDALDAGDTLLIPGTNGFIYEVESGDTVAKLAKHYQASKQRIITYNSLEKKGLKKGQDIVIPDGILPSSERPKAYNPTASSMSSGGGSVASTSGYHSAAVVGNRYAYGYCTWYAYNRRAQLGKPVGSFWGNAATWASYARSSGYTVNHRPAPGAVMQSAGGWGGYGHVAVVESVNSDGSITVSEMNYAGWGIVDHRTISAGQASSYNYIH